MAFQTPQAGQIIRATHVAQFVQWLTAAKLDSPGVIAATSASEYALIVRSQETSAGYALHAQYGSSGAPVTILAANKSQVTVGSPLNLGVATAPAAGVQNVTAGTEIAPITLATRYGGSERYGALNLEMFAHATATGGVEYGAITARNFVHAGTGGHHAGVWGFARATGTFVGSGDHSVSGMIGIGESVRDGVTVRGANFIARHSGVNAFTSGLLAGVEINISNYATSTTVARRGLSVGYTGGTGAYVGADVEQDVHIAVTNKYPATGSLIGLGFLAPSIASGATEGVLFPVRATGSLIWASGTNRNGTGTNVSVAYGVNFANLTFSSFAWISNGFSVNGGGTMVANSAQIATLGSLETNATMLLRLNGANRFTFGTDGGLWASVPSASPGFGVSETGGTVRYALAMSTTNQILLGNTAVPLMAVATTTGFFGATGATRQTLSATAANSAANLTLTNEIRATLIAYGLAQ